MRIQVTPRGNQILYFVYTAIWVPILIPLMMVDFLLYFLLSSLLSSPTGTAQSNSDLLLFTFVERQIRKTRFWITGMD